jgi:predicted kinase
LAEIVLCCGKVCSGKSTFTRLLEKKYNYYTFSADDWMLQLYEETEYRLIFDNNLLRCTELIYRVSEQILKNNSKNNIALDFGFWKRSNREEIIDRFINQGFTASLVYFPIELEQQIQYMDNRQKEIGLNHYKFNTETVITLNKYFEEPEITENYKSKEEYIEIISNRSFS